MQSLAAVRSARRARCECWRWRTRPFPKQACKALGEAGVAYKYLEYGSYFGEWRPRGALKAWTGWPTFPMVFVKGVLVGGANELKKLIQSGEIKTMLG